MPLVPLASFNPSATRCSHILIAPTLAIGRVRTKRPSISANACPLRARMPPHIRPYFEVLVVSPARRTAWQQLAQDLRKLRRPLDKFVYEPVFVSSFEDAVLATILNGSIEAVIVYEGISLHSSHNSPVLREFLTSHLAVSGISPRFHRLQHGARPRH